MSKISAFRNDRHVVEALDSGTFREFCDNGGVFSCILALLESLRWSESLFGREVRVCASGFAQKLRSVWSGGFYEDLRGPRAWMV